MDEITPEKPDYVPRNQYGPHIETSQLICCANQLNSFYMRAILVYELTKAT